MRTSSRRPTDGIQRYLPKKGYLIRYLFLILRCFFVTSFLAMIFIKDEIINLHSGTSSFAIVKWNFKLYNNQETPGYLRKKGFSNIEYDMYRILEAHDFLMRCLVVICLLYAFLYTTNPYHSILSHFNFNVYIGRYTYPLPKDYSEGHKKGYTIF